MKRKRGSCHPAVTLFLSLCLFSMGHSAYAEDYDDEMHFQNGEEMDFAVKYKYGLVVITAATGQHTIKATTYSGESAMRSMFTLKTTSFFNSVYKIRDTLTSYARTPDLQPLYFHRIVHEPDYHFYEWMTTKKFSNEQTQVYLKRVREKRDPVDSVMVAKAAGYDILGAINLFRTLAYDSLAIGTARRITVFFGFDQTNLVIRYTGKHTITVGKYRYKTVKLNIDIVNIKEGDNAFTTSKDALEVWLSDDPNRVPIRMKAKLKFGAIEGELTGTKNLKHPFAAQFK
ncbi:hypothetical protein SAMD00024442_35_18 [Candidatus Symbiothrix dinenymphae]|nr:hypothetical protein SAMD00024442_35_18 [Candidatus Symbiothrix dinenymphae]